MEDFENNISYNVEIKDATAAGHKIHTLTSSRDTCAQPQKKKKIDFDETPAM